MYMYIYMCLLHERIRRLESDREMERVEGATALVSHFKSLSLSLFYSVYDIL